MIAKLVEVQPLKAVELEPRIVKGEVDFAQKGVALKGSVHVVGTDAQVQAHMRKFEVDMEVNNKIMFPEPEPAEPVMEFEEIEKEPVEQVLKEVK